MTARLVVLVFLGLALAACAPTSRIPAIDDELAAAEARKQRIGALESQLRYAERLQSVGYAVLRAMPSFAAIGCGGRWGSWPTA